MVTLEVHNRVIKIFGADRRTIRVLEQNTSYLVEGSYFAPSFKSGRWDGREKLLKQTATHVWTYSGLLLDVLKALRGIDCEFRLLDKTEKGARKQLIWSAEPGCRLRPYQERVVSHLLSTPSKGIGVAVMPIRSGKSKTAARCIFELGRSALVIVPSTLLLHQMKDTLSECFPHEDIGLIGDSTFKPEFITVATVQSLQAIRNAKGSRWNSIANRFDVLVIDEAHHARGGGDWHKVFVEFNARYRLGFSATLFEDSNVEQGRGIIWARAACGPVRARVTTEELVSGGFLMKQHVTMYNVTEPTRYKHTGWSATIGQKCIHENPERNGIIARLCERFVAEDRKVIVCVNRRNHIAALVDKFEDLGIDHRVITGSDSQERRRNAIDGLVSGECGVVIGTVLREGVDIPAVDVVINAEGGRDLKNTIQRQRNLTVSKGKTQAIFVDFMDLTNKTLARHSRARLKTYRSESTTTVEVKDWEC